MDHFLTGWQSMVVLGLCQQVLSVADFQGMFAEAVLLKPLCGSESDRGLCPMQILLLQCSAGLICCVSLRPQVAPADCAGLRACREQLHSRSFFLQHAISILKMRKYTKFWNSQVRKYVYVVTLE